LSIKNERPLYHHSKFGDLPLYRDWKKVPSHLMTEVGLKKHGKRRTPLQRPVAVVHTQNHRRHHYHLLYNVAETIEKRPYTARQKAALHRARAKVTCRRCGASFVQLSPDGYCADCQPQVEQRQKARTRAIRWAETLVRRPFLVLDTETTGLRPLDRIVEIAVIDGDGHVLLDTLINPERYIPADVIGIHGITDAMVRDQPTFREILPMLEEILADRPIVIYNAAFDKRFLARSGLNVGQYNFQCAMLKYAQFFGAWSRHHNNWRRQSLQKACAACGVQQHNMHRAVADCEATRQVVYCMASART
jgi:DNA polymerase III subunit epsilon